MTSFAEHPLTNWSDSIASGGRWSDDEIDTLVKRCVDSQSEMSAETLRRELSRWTRKISEQVKDGNSGAARQLAREAVAVLAVGIGELPPARRDEGKSVKEIVDSIPRHGRYI